MHLTHRSYPARPLVAALLFGLAALASACNLGPTDGSTPSPAATSSVSPTATPMPAVKRVVLVAPTEADPSIAQPAEAALKALAAGSEMEFVRQPELPESDAAELALLFALAPDPALQAWAAAHPEVQTVGIGIAGLQPTPNLSLIAPEGLRYDQLGFALGYLAGMATPEYRIGALALDGSPTALALARGFVAGGTYYCGLCRPLHPPYLDYPVLLEAAPPDLASAGVATLIVAPTARTLTDLGIPIPANVSLVGTGPVGDELAPLWMAAAEFDVPGALETLWEQVNTGQGGQSLPFGIRYYAVDPERVSAGRLAHAEALLPDLVAGRIDTGLDPATGQPR